MPATVNVNALTVVHKNSNGVSICFPDVCKTPTPSGPVPIPYPNVAMSKDTSRGSQTVSVDGNPIMLKGSVYSTSTGDEAGSAGGVISNVTKGNAEFVNYSFDVQVEGKNVCRLLDPMAQNKSPCTGNGTGPANMQPPIVVVPVVQQVAEAKVLLARVHKVEMQSGIPLWTTDPKTGNDEQLPPSGEAHWHAGKKKYPACFVRDGAKGSPQRKVKVTVKVKTTLSGQAKLTAENLDVKIEGQASVSPSDTFQDVVFDCEFEQLPNRVRFLKFWRFPWKLTLGGQTRWLNSTLLTLYIVDEEPKPVTWPEGASDAQNWYDWVLEYSCTWAHEKTGADQVFAAIWDKFSDGTKARVPHATGWQYWASDSPAQYLHDCPKDAPANGWSCRAICHFFMMAIAAHGIECSDVEPHGAGYVFIVASWTFKGKGEQFTPPLPAETYYAGDWDDSTPPNRQADSLSPAPDATRKAAPGQGQDEPPLGFKNHWIVDLKSGTKGLYDTSYGGSMKTDLKSYQAWAVSGWLYGRSGTAWFIIKGDKKSMIRGSQTGRAHT